ncbi:nitroreductase family deazaflavin-dependent oxidoreductase [Nakamurella sp. GG22]
MTTTGRRTGLPRTVIVQFFPDHENLIVVAANSGLPNHPAWYLNLKAHRTPEPRSRDKTSRSEPSNCAPPRQRTSGHGSWPPHRTTPATDNAPPATSHWYVRFHSTPPGSRRRPRPGQCRWHNRAPISMVEANCLTSSAARVLPSMCHCMRELKYQPPLALPLHTWVPRPGTP